MKSNTLNPLSTLPSLKPLFTQKIEILNIPSEIDLLLLSTNLLYKSKLLLDKEIQETSIITAKNCTYQAMKLLHILDDYQNRYLTHKEFKAIKKLYKLNSLYR